MEHPDCDFCTDRAIGVDEDGAFTCGADHCTACAGPMPAVIEVSDDEETDAEEDVAGA